MNASRPARCLFSASSMPTVKPRIRCQKFHCSPNLAARRRPRFASIKASEMGLVTNQRTAAELFKPYSSEDKEALAKMYSPELLEVIEAGEMAVNPEDLHSHGVIRTDPGTLLYIDDLSQTRPVIDKRPRYDDVPFDPNARLMTEDEMGDEFGKYISKIREENPVPDPPADNPEDPEYLEKIRPNRLDFMRAMNEVPFMMGSNGPLPNGPSSLIAPGIPRDMESMDGETKKLPIKEEDGDPRDPDGVYARLQKETGLTLDQIFSLKVRILVSHRVVNQTRLGKISSNYVLAVAGNQHGILGIGEAKGTEDVVNNARIAAIRNMKPIPRYEERTIFGEVEGKVSAVEVKLMSRPPGFGLRCQQIIFEMAKAAGIHDLSARVPRSRNKMNTVKATYQALMSQRIPDEIARGRGKKLVDVRKVYYGGRV